MAKSTSVESASKPAKPCAEFPLFPHSTSRWAKKVRGRMRYFGQVSTDPHRPLAEQFAPLLALFAPGECELQYYTLEHLQLIERRTADYELDGYYPLDWVLVGTQPAASLDTARIAFYRQQIQQGMQPVVVTTAVEDKPCDFIIDGHHNWRPIRR
jgi:hypothetical protein